METEHQRHQKAREAILRGEEAPKRIMVQMTNTKEDKERSEEARLERERKNERSDALKEARTPWFCPKCNKVMKHRNDDKMYRLNGQCFDCQIKFEHQLRLEGKFEEWEEKIQKHIRGNLDLALQNPFLQVSIDKNLKGGKKFAEHQVQTRRAVTSWGGIFEKCFSIFASDVKSFNAGRMDIKVNKILLNKNYN